MSEAFLLERVNKADERITKQVWKPGRGDVAATQQRAALSRAQVTGTGGVRRSAGRCHVVLPRRNSV